MKRTRVVDAELQDLSGHSAQSICEGRRAALRKLIRKRNLRDAVIDRRASLPGWRETRADFRVLRLDGMSGLALTETTFRPERGQRIEDYLARSPGPG